MMEFLRPCLSRIATTRKFNTVSVKTLLSELRVYLILTIFWGATGD